MSFQPVQSALGLNPANVASPPHAQIHSSQLHKNDSGYFDAFCQALRRMLDQIICYFYKDKTFEEAYQQRKETLVGAMLRLGQVAVTQIEEALKYAFTEDNYEMFVTVLGFIKTRADCLAQIIVGCFSENVILFTKEKYLSKIIEEEKILSGDVAKIAYHNRKFEPFKTYLERLPKNDPAVATLLSFALQEKQDTYALEIIHQDKLDLKAGHLVVSIEEKRSDVSLAIYAKLTPEERSSAFKAIRYSFRMALQDKMDAFQFMIAQGFQPTSQDLVEAICFATQNRSLEEVETLFALSDDLENLKLVKDRYGNGPLYYALERLPDSAEMCKALLDKGYTNQICCKAQGKESSLLLVALAKDADQEIIKKLIEGSDDVMIDAEDEDCGTALHVAITKRNSELAQACINKDAVLTVPFKGKTPYQRALDFRNEDIQTRIANKRLDELRSGAFEFPDQVFARLIKESAHSDHENDIECISILMDQPTIQAALTSLVPSQHPKKENLLRILFTAGARLGPVAQKSTDLILFQSALRKQNDPDMRQFFDLNALLRIAVQMGQENLIEELVQSGANINHQNDSGNTCLHMALSLQYVGLTKILVSLGASKEIPNRDGETPIALAESLNNPELIEVFQPPRAVGLIESIRNFFN